MSVGEKRRREEVEVPMPLFGKPHGDHERHLCSKVTSGTSVEEYKELVRNAKFLCRQCGRVAAREGNLCDPIPL